MEGHSLGAVTVDTMTSSALVLTVVALALLTIGTDASTSTLLLLAAPVGLIFPILFDPVQRTLWNAIELLMRPPQANEIREEFRHIKVR